jgi:hypothetical protein
VGGGGREVAIGRNKQVNKTEKKGKYIINKNKTKLRLNTRN